MVIVGFLLLLLAPMLAHAQGGGPDTLQVVWTATGDDAAVGTAASYEIRVSTAPITSANWSAANVIGPAPLPLPSGSRQGFTVRGLSTDTTYYIAMIVADDAGNPSALSNVLRWDWSADGSPPSIPAGVQAVRAGADVRITWDAIGDADLDGYSVYRATSVAGPFVRVSATLMTPTQFLDTSVPAGESQIWYKVSATDLSGNEGAQSSASQVQLAAASSGAWSLSPVYPNPSSTSQPVCVPITTPAAGRGQRRDRHRKRGRPPRASHRGPHRGGVRRRRRPVGRRERRRPRRGARRLSRVARGRRHPPEREAGAGAVMRARTLIIVAAAAGLAAAPARAGIERAGTTAANFLAIGSNPAVLGMGGAGLSLADGLSAFDWNPATLAGFGRAEAVFTHAALADQTAQEWAGFGSRLRFGGLSGAVTGLFQSEGSFDGRDALGNPTGTFDVSSMAVSAGLARAFGPFMCAGVGLKYASENLGNVRGSGVALDAGLQIRSAGFGFGAAAQNVLGRMRYGSASYDFPANFGIGFSYQQPSPTGLRVAFDMNFPAAYYSDFRAGLEWRWNDRFALRTGYRAELGAASGEPLNGPTFGMGAGAAGMWFDYGYLVGGAGSGQHRIAMTFHPGRAPDGPEHRDGLGHASTPETRGREGAAEKSKRDEAPASASAHAPVGAPTASGAHAPASTPAPPAASAPSSARAPSSAPAPPAASAPSSARAPAGAKSVAGAAQGPAPRPQPDAASPAKTPAASSAPATGAGGPVAAQLASPPSYAQRAKAARGTGESAASDRKAAALEPPSNAAKPAPAQSPPSSNAAPKAASAPAPTSAPISASAPAPVAAAKPDTTRAAVAAQPAPKPGPRPDKVRVKSGQTMADIARTYGTSVAAIMMENNLVTDQVRPGQVLRLPRR
jgi:LysM repeat protein